MTDEMIIKALECAIEYGCGHYIEIDAPTIKNALDLIKSQNAEIERLKKENLELEIEKFKCNTKVGTLTGRITLMGRDIPFIKAEAIKDFAERLKENEFFANFTYKGEARLIIDNLVKEMIGEQDESIQQEDC